MISKQRIDRLLVFLCKHLPPGDVQSIKGDIEEILGFDIAKATAARRARREREAVAEALAAATIS